MLVPLEAFWSRPTMCQGPRPWPVEQSKAEVERERAISLEVCPPYSSVHPASAPIPCALPPPRRPPAEERRRNAQTQQLASLSLRAQRTAARRASSARTSACSVRAAASAPQLLRMRDTHTCTRIHTGEEETRSNGSSCPPTPPPHPLPCPT